MKVVLRVFGYMRKYWPHEIAAYLCMLGINAVRVIWPQFVARVVDVGIGENRPDVLTQMVFFLLGATLLQGVFRFFEGFLTERVSQGIAYNLRNEIYRKLQGLSFSYHDRAQTGQLLSRATSDVDRLQRITGRGVLGLIDALVLLVGTTVALFRMNALLAPMALVVMPIITVFMRSFIERVHPLFHARQDQTAILTSRLEQNLRGMHVVRGFAQEGGLGFG